MSTIARNARLIRSSLSDQARRLCEDERGLEQDEPLPHLKQDDEDRNIADHTNLPEKELYNQPEPPDPPAAERPPRT